MIPGPCTRLVVQSV